jgi:PhnB protein
VNPTKVEPYLFFGGRCEEALAYYQQAVGAEVVMLMKYKDNPSPDAAASIPMGFEDKIMHATFRIGESILMASDGCDDSIPFQGFRLSLACGTREEAERAFAELAHGGIIQLPLTATFWSPCFGMLKDRFGVDWMVTLSTEAAD